MSIKESYQSMFLIYNQKIGKFEFVVKIMLISRINFVNLHSLVSDNCVIIHSNIMHTCASWGVLLYNIANWFFPPQNLFFCPSSSRFKPGGFYITHLSVWGVFVRGDRCGWRTAWETPFIVLGKNDWNVRLLFLPPNWYSLASTSHHFVPPLTIHSLMTLLNRFTIFVGFPHFG